MARFFGTGNFIAGIKTGQMVWTAIGAVEIPASPLADGPVLLSIRPEAIEIGSGPENSFAGRVEANSFRVPAARYVIKIKGVQIDLAPPPYHDLNVGEEIRVHFPCERICVLPAEDETVSA